MTLLARKLSGQVTCGGGRHREMGGTWRQFNNQPQYLLGKVGGDVIAFSFVSDYRQNVW